MKSKATVGMHGYAQKAVQDYSTAKHTINHYIREAVKMNRASTDASIAKRTPLCR